MKLKELLQQILDVSDKIGASEPYCCGGVARDKYLKNIKNISDLDITTGDKSVHYLSQEFSNFLGKKYNVITRNHEDGHTSIHIGKFKIDFSSNFNVPNIEELLKKQGVNNPTDLQKEMYSRDFTCNSLLLSFDFKDIIDPTKNGLKDIDNKIINTCLSPDITLISNKNRVIRSIYLATKLDFDISPDIINYVSKNPESIKIASEKTLIEKLNNAFEIDGDKAAHYLSKMKVWEYIPIIKSVEPYFMKRNVKKAYFQGGGGVNEPTPKKKKYKSDTAIVNQTRFKEPFYNNYDLYDIPGFEHIGPGAGWHSMQKYKSISEFLKAKRKKMKDKYKADDSWITDSGKIVKNHTAARTSLLSKIIKNAIDFPADEYIDPAIVAPETGTPVENANLLGGYLDKYLPQDDFEDKQPTTLDFGRDYVEPEEQKNKKQDKLEDIEKLLEKYLTHGLYGLPDGVDLKDGELGDPTNINPYYGTIGPESSIYEDKWNI